MLATTSRSANADGAYAVDVWWPVDSTPVSGTQPFKAMISNQNVEQYEMFWQVDNGEWNRMYNSYTDYPHKEAMVDVSNWNWKGSGPYTINFIVSQNGQTVATRQVALRTNSSIPAPSIAQEATEPTQQEAKFTPIDKVASALLGPVANAQEVAPALTKSVSQPAPEPKPAPEPTPAPKQEVRISSPNSVYYVNPNTNASRQADEWRSSRPQDAAMMDRLAAQPVGQWLGGWNADVEADVRKTAQAAAAQNATAIFIAYNIPGRDCGSYSAGGTSADKYSAWISSIARGIGNTKAIVILEPDALAGITCLSPQDQQTRYDLLTKAIETLKSNPQTKVYLDAGHSRWLSVADVSERLIKANVARADGFSLNVSNFQLTTNEIQYGNELSGKINGKHYVIDTSRNGRGPEGDTWCNPRGRAIGTNPTGSTGQELVDAYLWLKTPGESDGSCNGAPSAGTWWPDYALELVKNAQ
ncbi:MAG TPA: glycoside hydrolase family 6 protein [Candidatus Paceibacterota bacterium]|nr:glycoside hydrolase family 6 protein [Candidatus Paceibacterota bacterium]